MAFQANQLPCPEVEITIPGRQPYMVYASHTLKPRFEGTDRGSYKALSSRSPLTVRDYSSMVNEQDRTRVSLTALMGIAPARTCVAENCCSDS